MYLFVVMVVPNECLIKVEKDANIVATIGFNYILKKPSSYLNNWGKYPHSICVIYAKSSTETLTFVNLVMHSAEQFYM